jgi:hypothetical protein
MNMSIAKEPPKNGDLPGITGKGVELVSIKEVNDLVDLYVTARDARMLCTRREVEAKEKLISSLRYHSEQIGADKDGALVYRHDDFIVILRHGKDDLKVRTEGAEENAD